MKTIKARIRFIEPVLGGTPMNEELYRDYIGSLAPKETDTSDEVESLSTDEVVEKGKTTFPMEDEKPFLFDYHIKGFFKSACGFLRPITTTQSNKLKSYKKAIDGDIFVFPRKIFFENAGEMRECQRPLRASTPMGERVALAISDEIPEGAELEFFVECFQDAHVKMVVEWLNYGKYSGLCQWRNSGKGRFEVVSLEISNTVGFWETEKK